MAWFLSEKWYVVICKSHPWDELTDIGTGPQYNADRSKTIPCRGSSLLIIHQVKIPKTSTLRNSTDSFPNLKCLNMSQMESACRHSLPKSFSFPKRLEFYICLFDPLFCVGNSELECYDFTDPSWSDRTDKKSKKPSGFSVRKHGVRFQVKMSAYAGPKRLGWVAQTKNIWDANDWDKWVILSDVKR